VTWHGLSLIGTLVTIGVTVAFLAGLYDLTFLSEYLGARPQDGPGYEHLLFSVLANVLSTPSLTLERLLKARLSRHEPDPPAALAAAEHAA
jgi:hypothetical protein